MFELTQRQHNAWSSGHWGFTLVEVLIVVAILAVLVAALVGASIAINTQRDTALTKNCLDVLDATLAEFRAITGKYPVDAWDDDGGKMRAVGSLIDGATWGNVEPNSDELLYLQLSLLPQTREMISKLPVRLVVAAHNDAKVQLAHDLTEDTPYLQSIVDAWGNALSYDDYDDPDRFPLIRSDGPDGPNAPAGDGATDDDINNED